MTAPSLAVLRIEDWRPADHSTAACMSTWVGSSTWSTTGVPWVTTAIIPRPVKVVLNRPPLITEAPSTRLMSHVRLLSNARTARPLTVTASSSSSRMKISSASWARKTSPLPETFISDMPSPVRAFLNIFPSPPAPS